MAGLRALLPVVTAVSQLHEVRLRNADDKTVTRIAVDAMALPGPCPGSLPTRLAVTGVRGYAGAARRACRILGDTPGVTLSGQTALDAALHAAGRHALDYTGKVDVALGPGMPGAEAVTAILLQQLDTLEANVDGVLHDTDTEFLHDLRIAVRRTRSALKLLGDMLPGELTLRFASEFRWLGDITTPLRDLDVQLMSVPPMAAGLVAARAADLDPFLAYLARRRTAERRKLSRALRSARFAAMVGDWRKALLVPREARGRRGCAPPSCPRTVPGAPTGASSSWARRSLPSSPPESLHTLRKRGKELRYVLEFFASLHDPQAYRAVLSDLKRLQDCLGDFQDSQVQQEEIQSLAAAMLTAGAAPAPTLLAMGELAAQLGPPPAPGPCRVRGAVRRLRGEPGPPPDGRADRGGPRMKVIATYNIKGGVGKTTAAVNLGYLAAQDGLRTLLWDLDPQAAATYMFRVRPRVKGGGKALIRGHPVAGRRDQGHRLRPPRPPAGRLHLPEYGPAARPGQKPGPPAFPAARPAGRRLRRRAPRLPAQRLAGVGERAARRRPDPRPAYPGHPLAADAGSAHRFRGGLRRPPA